MNRPTPGQPPNPQPPPPPPTYRPAPPTPPPTWLDRARAAGDWDMVNAYLDEQLDPIPFPAYPLTTRHDALLMRWTLLHLPTLPSVNPKAMIAIVCG